MSNITQPEKNSSTALQGLQAAAKTIDGISKAAMEAFASPESFERELAVATAVQQMREALTPAVMSEVMALMNTSIGFDTDKNPKKSPGVEPYSPEVVRDCFIESRLRGFHVVGKEFTIIAGNFYAGVNGLDRIVRNHKKVFNFRDTYEVPRSLGDKGALVKCKAEWLQLDDAGGKQPQTLEREFAVRVNVGQGADAICGKAKRKLLAAVLSRLTGQIVPEGDADDVPLAPAKPVDVVTVSPSNLFQKPAGDNTPASFKKPEDDVPMNGKTPLAETPKPSSEPIDQFSAELVTAGVSFDDFRSFLIAKNIAKQADSWASMGEVPHAVAELFYGASKLKAELIKKFGKQAAK